MLAPKADVGSRVSDAAGEKFMAACERAFARWPQPVEAFDPATVTPMPLRRLVLGPERNVVAARQPFSPRGVACPQQISNYAGSSKTDRWSAQ